MLIIYSIRTYSCLERIRTTWKRLFLSHYPTTFSSINLLLFKYPIYFLYKTLLSINHSRTLFGFASAPEKLVKIVFLMNDVNRNVPHISWFYNPERKIFLFQGLSTSSNHFTLKARYDQRDVERLKGGFCTTFVAYVCWHWWMLKMTEKLNLGYFAIFSNRFQKNLKFIALWTLMGLTLLGLRGSIIYFSCFI